MIFFTSDLHLGHERIISICRRPFSDAKKMNEAIVEKYNAVVLPDDTVYFLGDMAHKIPLEEAQALFARLHGKKHLILGNHDMPYDYTLPYKAADGQMYKMFEEICETKIIEAEAHTLVLMHYPLLSWFNSRKGTIMLHGHIHSMPQYNNDNQQQGLLRFDVGVDANDFTPVSLTRILEMANTSRKNVNYEQIDNYLDAEMKPGMRK